MGIRCSLLGHEYGEPETEREREERGNEVVVTVREVKECARCGEQTVVTENTEVTALDTETTTEPDEPTPDTGGDAEFEYKPPVEEPEEDDGVILEEDDSGPSPGDWPPAEAPDEPAEADASDDMDVEIEPAADTADDAEADADDPAEAASETAETPSESAEEASPWPEHHSDDEGFDAGFPDSEDADVEFGGGLTPEANDDLDEDENVQYVSADSTGSAAGITSAGPSNAGPKDAVDTVFVCPECGFERESYGSSLRAGDICPECRRGYLAERER
ncbi:oxidoreductase [Halobacteriaceae archaeon GCM10025711]